VLVATDVAARGLDIADLGIVVHYDLPGDPDTFTHRSGRTGRAGKKGRCVVLVPESHRRKAAHIARACRVDLQLQPMPSPAEIAERVEARALELLSTATPDEATRARYGRLAQALLATQDAEAAVAMLLGRSRALGPCEPLATRPVGPMSLPRPAREGTHATPGYVRFQVSWGQATGADPRRLLAVVCRRGDVDRHAIGAIRIQEQSSFVDVIEEAADHFERASSERDPREPRIKFRRDRGPAMGPGGGRPSGPRPGGKAPPRRPRDAGGAEPPKARRTPPR
jgi:ATP-dependent RNA helicase DeaD